MTGCVVLTPSERGLVRLKLGTMAVAGKGGLSGGAAVVDAI